MNGRSVPSEVQALGYVPSRPSDTSGWYSSHPAQSVDHRLPADRPERPAAPPPPQRVIDARAALSAAVGGGESLGRDCRRSTHVSSSEGSPASPNRASSLADDRAGPTAGARPCATIHHRPWRGAAHTVYASAEVMTATSSRMRRTAFGSWANRPRNMPSTSAQISGSRPCPALPP